MKRLVILCFMICTLFNAFAQFQPTHTVTVILENKAYDQIVGNPQAPFINSIINSTNTALLTQSFALTHPSQPKYIMLFSGSHQGVTDNSLPANLPFAALNLGALLLQKGLRFTGYAEDLPSVG